MFLKKYGDVIPVTECHLCYPSALPSRINLSNVLLLRLRSLPTPGRFVFQKIDFFSFFDNL